MASRFTECRKHKITSFHLRHNEKNPPPTRLCYGTFNEIKCFFPKTSRQIPSTKIIQSWFVFCFSFLEKLHCFLSFFFTLQNLFCLFLPLHKSHFIAGIVQVPPNIYRRVKKIEVSLSGPDKALYRIFFPPSVFDLHIFNTFFFIPWTLNGLTTTTHAHTPHVKGTHTQTLITL